MRNETELGGTAEKAQYAARRRLEGATLAEIGVELGLTRERARQLCLKAGLSKEAVKVAREHRALEITVALRQRAIKDLELHPGTTAAEAANRLEEDLNTLRRKLPRALLKLYAPESRETEHTTTWPKEDIARVLQESELLSFPLTTKAYRELRAERLIEGPSGARIHQVFGSWANACAYAGVECGAPRAGGYSSRWTDDDLWAAVTLYLYDASTTGTFAGYNTWSRQRDDMPSAQTVRNRLGKWAIVKREALQRARKDVGGC